MKAIASAARKDDARLGRRAGYPIRPASSAELMGRRGIAEPVLRERSELAIDPGELLVAAEPDRDEQTGAA